VNRQFLHRPVWFALVSLVAGVLSLGSFVGKGFCWSVKLDLDDLTNKTSNVITGKVLSKKSSWSRQRTKIYTHVTISVKDQIKGFIKEKKIVVRHLGGEIPEEDIGMKVSEMPEFRVDQEVLLFVKPDTTGLSYEVVGGCQGKYTVKDSIVVERHLPLSDFRDQVSKIIDNQKLEDQQ
jgi:hypothetical protein